MKCPQDIDQSEWMSLSDDMQSWISAKIPILIKDGTAKDQKQAYAIARSMYEKEHDLADGNAPVVPILTTGKTKNGYPITDDIYNEVKETYDPVNVHKAPIVIGPHDDDHLKPVAWVNGLGEKILNGKKWLTAQSIEYADGGKEALRQALKDYKFDSPELSPLEPEFYDRGRSETFPDEVAGKYGLRRLNIVPLPAQFGMPEARLSDNGRTIRIVRLAELAMKNKKIDSVDDDNDDESLESSKEKPSAKLADSTMKCPDCGESYSNGEAYCPMDGTKLEKETKEMADKVVTPPPLPDNDKVLAELKKLREDFEAQKLATESANLQLAETQKQLKEVQENAAKDARERREESIGDEISRLQREGEIKPAIADRLFRVMMLADKIKEPLKLADDKEESVIDSIRFIAKNGGGTPKGVLKVVAPKAEDGRVLTLSEQQQVEIEKVAKEKDFDLKTSKGQDLAAMEAARRNPEIFRQVTEVPNA